jgi:hypothetical protein
MTTPSCPEVRADRNCAAGQVACYPDRDRDGWVEHVAPQMRCGGCNPSEGEIQQLSFPLAWDCGDESAFAHPGQTSFFSSPYVNKGRSEWDYNCDGAWEPRADHGTCKIGWTGPSRRCEDSEVYVTSTAVECGKKGPLLTCSFADEKCTSIDRQDVTQTCR